MKKVLKMSNETYDTLKWVAQTGLPAVNVLCAGLIEIWGLPYGAQVTGTIAAINMCLGAMLGISNASYKKTNGNTDGKEV